MRAYEILGNTGPPQNQITLRGLHKMKNEAKAKAREEQERAVLMRLMYGNAEHRREQLELERLELEMAQLRAEILATNAETASKSAMALHRSAKSGIKADQNQRQKITKLAKSGLGRDLKL